jgi:uncharacterized protein YcbK (DUF882 family)
MDIGAAMSKRQYYEILQARRVRLPCCGEGADKMDAGLLQHLDSARHMAGVPFVINSAYRCERHNKEVGVVPGSAHTKGLAVDIAAVGSRQRFLIAQSLLARGLTRIGVASSFVHVDVDKAKDQRVLWLYD